MIRSAPSSSPLWAMTALSTFGRVIKHIGAATRRFCFLSSARCAITCINGEWYEMKRHGVARHEEFTVTEQGEDYVTLQLTANEETKKQYPFDFVLTVSYYLTGSSITTKFTVKNPDSVR